MTVVQCTAQSSDAPSDIEKGSDGAAPILASGSAMRAEERPLADYTCPICLELLLRPVKLSCGHYFCRGCWTHVLQGRAARATAHLSGTAACPFRCEVRPLVPEIDETLASQLESHFAEEYERRASSTSLPDEERRSTSFNEWVAQGCTLDAHEVAKQAEEAATAQAARVQARTEGRLRNMIIDVSVVGAVLLVALLVLVLMTAAHPTFASTHPGTMPALISLAVISAAIVLLDALLAWLLVHPRSLAVVLARNAAARCFWSRMLLVEWNVRRLLCCLERRAGASSETSTPASTRTRVHPRPGDSASRTSRARALTEALIVLERERDRVHEGTP